MVALKAVRAEALLVDRLRRGLPARWLSTADLPVKGTALRFVSLRDGPAGRP